MLACVAGEKRRRWEGGARAGVEAAQAIEVPEMVRTFQAQMAKKKQKLREFNLNPKIRPPYKKKSVQVNTI